MTRKFNSANNDKSIKTIKFLYSYGGRIVPRPADGKLRYVGGTTRILAVDRSISYTELVVKFWESCGSSMNMRCKLPTEDLDVLVSVTCDEDLANVIEEYERTNQDLKIIAVLDPIKSVKEISPPPSPVNFTASKTQKATATQRPFFNFSASKPSRYPVAGLVPPSAVAAYRCYPKAVGCYPGQQVCPRRNHFVPERINYRL